MSKRLDLARLKGDLAGGATSAVLTVPVSMGYGVLALLPLGDQYVPVGILAGLYSAIFIPLTILLLGDRLQYSPWIAAHSFSACAQEESTRQATHTKDRDEKAAFQAGLRENSGTCEALRAI